MNRPLLRTVLLLILLLASGAGLTWMWLDTEGQIKNSQWQRPIAVAAVIPDISITEPFGVGLDDASLQDIVDRPLFATDRKALPPPPPPPPPAPPPPPDALKEAQLVGLIAGEPGFVILRAEGKMRNIQRQSQIGDWVLTDIRERVAVFQRGEETRQLVLEYAKLGVPSPATSSPSMPGLTPMPSNTIPGIMSDNARSALEERRRRREAARNGPPAPPSPTGNTPP